MALRCEKVVLACSYCKSTHFSTTLHLQKHWKNACREKCEKDCTCKKCSPVYCETKIEHDCCIEYLNQFTICQETFLTYLKKNKRWFFFPIKN